MIPLRNALAGTILSVLLICFFTSCQSAHAELTEAERKIAVRNAPAAEFLDLNCTAVGGVIEAPSTEGAIKIAAQRGATHVQQFQVGRSASSNFNIQNATSSYAYRAWSCPQNANKVCGGIAVLKCTSEEICEIKGKHPDATGFCVRKP